MNAITAFAAYSFFPYETFEQRRSIVMCSKRNYRKEFAFQKYTRRGWRLAVNVYRHERENPKSPFHPGDRWLGDGKTWIVPFGTRGVQYPRFSPAAPPVDFDPFIMNAWHISSEVLRSPKLEWNLLYGRMLRFQYTTVPYFFNFIMPMMIEQGCLTKLHQDADEPVDADNENW